MRNIIISLALFLFACQSKPKQIINDIAQEIVVNSAHPNRPDSIIGKYPYEVGLLDRPDIKARLQKLTGEHYEQISMCAVESQIEAFEDDFIHISIGFPRECDKVYCEIFINYNTDNISLYYRDYDHHYFFSENGEIGHELDRWKPKS